MSIININTSEKTPFEAIADCFPADSAATELFSVAEQLYRQRTGDTDGDRQLSPDEITRMIMLGKANWRDYVAPQDLPKS